MREPAKIIQFVEMFRRGLLPIATPSRKLRRVQGTPSRPIGSGVSGFAIPPNDGK